MTATTPYGRLVDLCNGHDVIVISRKNGVVTGEVNPRDGERFPLMPINSKYSECAVLDFGDGAHLQHAENLALSILSVCVDRTLAEDWSYQFVVEYLVHQNDDTWKISALAVQQWCQLKEGI